MVVDDDRITGKPKEEASDDRTAEAVDSTL